MAIGTFSTFYYGHSVTKDNFYLNFKEGAGPELSAVIQIGSYTLTEFLIAIKTALDSAGALVYTVTVDRNTRLITISSTSTFSLLVFSGSQNGQSIWSLLGFSGADRTSASTYSGNLVSGSSYTTQFKLQDWTDSQDFQEKVDPTVLESASGTVETVNFGTRKLFEMSFKFITDRPCDNVVIRNNPNGVSSARSFFQYITQKKKFEMMIDSGNKNDFKKVLLESTPSASDGTGYKMMELVSKNLPGYYEINNIVLRDLT
jgi:hypothetical protein